MTLDLELFKHSIEVFKQAECLYSKDEVDAAIKSLADEINTQLEGTHPLVITVLNGGLIPAGLLLPLLNFPLQSDYLHATRYGKQTSGGELDWISNPSMSLKDRTILLIDDIHDEGSTLKHIIEYCHQQQAKSVFTCVLTHKNHERKFSPKPDFVGLEVPDRYVFGYGMDYKTMLRNAPGIYAVKGL